MKNYLRLFLLGVLTWIVPFITGFLFFDKTGQLAIDMYLFKSIMLIVGALIGSVAIVLYFKKIEKQYVKHGAIAGLTWFVINIILDIFILLPMSKMSMNEYIAQIGIRYLLIPIMCILVAYVLNKKLVSK